MSDVVIQVKNISKQYRLGKVGTGTIRHDMNRWWHSMRGKEDPYLKIGAANDRSKKTDSEYVWALRDINFEIKRGEAVGLIGRNGAGKSTLLKILSKITAPTTGEINVRGRIASLLEVGTGFHPELSGRENIFLNGAILGMRKWEIQKKLDEIIAFSGVEAYIDTPVKRYSSGMYVRLAFAVAAHLEPEILIIDEVLAVGDAEFQRKCLGKMGEISNKDGRTILFVSHNMGAVSNLTSSSLLIENGALVKVGLTDAVIEEYLSRAKSGSEMVNSNPNGIIHSVAIDYPHNTDYFKVFQPLKVRIAFKPNRLSSQRARFGITIASMDGESIMSGVSQHFETSDAEMQSFLLQINNFRLVPGRYKFSLSIGLGSFQEARREFEVLRDVVDLNIENVAHGEDALINWSGTHGKIAHSDIALFPTESYAV